LTTATLPPQLPTDVLHILADSRVIAVVGLSDDPSRPSYGVAQYLQAAGYRVIPVNPKLAEVLGERCYPSLTAAAQVEQIDLVDCFRTSSAIAQIADEAIAIGAKALWMQQGVAHPEAAHKLRAAGLLAVEDRCIKIDHRVWRASLLIR
jgi:uncharacterized protein